MSTLITWVSGHELSIPVLYLCLPLFLQSQAWASSFVTVTSIRLGLATVQFVSVHDRYHLIEANLGP